MSSMLAGFEFFFNVSVHIMTRGFGGDPKVLGPTCPVREDGLGTPCQLAELGGIRWLDVPSVSGKIHFVQNPLDMVIERKRRAADRPSLFVDSPW